MPRRRRIGFGVPSSVSEVARVERSRFLVARNGVDAFVVVDTESHVIYPDEIRHIGHMIDELIHRRPRRLGDEWRETIRANQSTRTGNCLDLLVGDVTG